jgi:hypothetical protein
VLRLFTENLLPIFLAAGVGYVLAARTSVNPRSLNHVAFYVFSPCLIFRIIVDNRVSGEAMLRVGAFAALGLIVLAGIAAVVAWRLGWSRSLVAAVTLVVLLPNAGNFGLSANLLAFGEPGLAGASLYFVTAAILSYTLGVFVASLGRASAARALAGLVRVPTIWSVALGFLMVRLDAALPLPVDTTVRLLADACIPVFLVILGMQLHGAAWRGRLVPLALGAGMRLGGGIGLALVLAGLFGLEGAERQSGILQSAMPSAVITIILATEYDVEPGFVTSAVLVTTVLSPFTLTPLLAYLGA